MTVITANTKAIFNDIKMLAGHVLMLLQAGS